MKNKLNKTTAKTNGNQIFTLYPQVSERDWQLTFLPAFEQCVKAGSYSLMCSFNKYVLLHVLLY